MPGGVLELQHMMLSHPLMTSMARVVGRRQQLDACLDSLGKVLNKNRHYLISFVKKKIM
jgi:hypothetical protein